MAAPGVLDGNLALPTSTMKTSKTARSELFITTDYRGTIATQAGKNPAPGAREKLHAMGIDVPEDLPTGVVYGVVDLADIVRDHPSRWAVDDYWHWVFNNRRTLARPVPLLGKQSLFLAPDEVERAVMSQLP
ncbi:hypothetical protein [Streptomyces cupreus]|uniref:Uncharacterized protein n=1 Tax=Streptomyces cupreus TaxID=2759956 RepID=A0A7X1MGG1_9ACTN|nr:hypothetical protein [Streptomyces cupreus]MBC2907705.1 hypothetical protein [Streptomyces cupreus]